MNDAKGIYGPELAGDHMIKRGATKNHQKARNENRFFSQAIDGLAYKGPNRQGSDGKRAHDEAYGRFGHIHRGEVDGIHEKKSDVGKNEEGKDVDDSQFGIFHVKQIVRKSVKVSSVCVFTLSEIGVWGKGRMGQFMVNRE